MKSKLLFLVAVLAVGLLAVWFSQSGVLGTSDQTVQDARSAPGDEIPEDETSAVSLELDESPEPLIIIDREQLRGD